MKKQPPEVQDYDLDRLKWLNPNSDTRFIRKEINIPGCRIAEQDISSEELLKNIVSLTDEIFDHLSVFEQFSETTSRGAIADLKKKLNLPDVKTCLIKAEEKLSIAHSTLKDQRYSFVQEQLDSLGIGENAKERKIHLGSGGYRLKGWLNIDAGGEDLALNVNWGLPFPDRSASFVYSAHLLEHLRFNDQAPVFVREIYRILSKGGTVRFVVPNIGKLLKAYVEKDREFFKLRQEFYPLSDGFLNDGVANLDYILLFCGSAAQTLNLNHKFGYDSTTLCKLLINAGFSEAKECSYQSSEHPELRVDAAGYNAQTKNQENEHYSLFVEATK